MINNIALSFISDTLCLITSSFPSFLLILQRVTRPIKIGNEIPKHPYYAMPHSSSIHSLLLIAASQSAGIRSYP